METTDMMIGKTLQGGKYKITGVLGQGGFGITYEGLQTALNRKVAIKEFFMKDFCERDADTSQVSIVGTAGNRSLVERFRVKFIREAQMIAGLEDVPHVIRVYDIFEENGTAYYVMQFVEGGSLENKVKAGGPLSEAQAFDYITQMGEALSRLHARNIMHLDVKPGNVLLRDGEVFLIDFGISKHYDEAGSATTTSPVGRSKGYAPIEQYRQGGVSSFTPATDIYSLGATAYFLVTGTPPPEAMELITDTLPRPAGVSDVLWNVISQAMRPNRNDRPCTVTEFLQLLRGKQQREVQPAVDDETTIDGVSAGGESIAANNIIAFTVRGITFNMVKVEGGTFQMGSAEGNSDEQPVHSVTLSGYSIGETEVTQALWEAVMGNNPSVFKGADLPVESVSWDDCQDFIRELNRLTGKTFRLPTEAEWEFAARGGNRSTGAKYAGSDAISRVAWYADNSGSRTHPVKGKSPNELGLYDMSGNVWEWCQDRYGSYSSGSQTNHKGAASGSLRVGRGGSWGDFAWNCRVAYRNRAAPSSRHGYLGFRLAL